MSIASTSPLMIQQNDPNKLIEYLMNDLRALSTEARKKHNHIKEAAESGLVKVRNVSSAATPESLLRSLRAISTEILHPFLLGCSSKSARLVQISLQSIQHMIQFRAIDQNAVSGIVNELWQLTEAECEELKVLQTITPFVSTELLITDWALAKCIVLAFRLNFSKDSSVINAASAAVRQLFSCVFERVIQEDGMRGGQELQVLPQLKGGQQHQQSLAPPGLRPAAADAFLLLRDLCILIRKESPFWLIGINKIAPILALELLESVVKNYPSVFFRHSEFAELLKTQICPQIVKMVVGDREITLPPGSNANHAPSQRPLPVSVALLSQQQQTYQHHQQLGQLVTKTRDFPTMIRSIRISLALLTHYHSLLGAQNELILTFLNELLNMPSTSWEAAVAIEVFRKILAQPVLLNWLCGREEGGKFVELLFSRLTTFVRKCMEEAANDAPSVREERFAQPGFSYKGVFLPFDESQLSQKRFILLDWLDKHNAEKIPEAYCLSVAFAALVEANHAVYSAIEGEQPRNATQSGEKGQKDGSVPGYGDKAKELFQSTYAHLISGISTLLEISADDSITQHLLSCFSSLAALASKIGIPDAKYATWKSICRSALPNLYFSRFVECTSPTAMQPVGNGSNGGMVAKEFLKAEQQVVPTQVVAMGTVCPSPHHSSQHFGTSVMLTAKNLQVARVLIGCAHSNGHLLGDCWEMVLTTIQHFVWIVGMRPTATGSFRAGGEAMSATEGISTTSSSTASTTILTTAASSEMPDLNQQLNTLFESTAALDEVSLHHVIAALCKLSNESMITSLANLSRLHIFWRPVTAHLLELCGHTSAITREWGALSLTQLVKNAMKQTVVELVAAEASSKPMDSAEIAKREQIVLNPLVAVSEIEFLDVRARQLDCLMRILQAESRPLEPQLWPTVIQIVTAVVAPDTRMNAITDPQLIDQGFRALSLVIKEFLGVVPFECVEMLVETDALYGQQQIHLNVSLASVGQLWDVSDYVRRQTTKSDFQCRAEQVWLTIYRALGRLCVDPRPPVRKSACDTLLQTVAAHGQALGTQCWANMLTEILFPMLERVRKLTLTASTQRSSSASLGAPNIMIHHSRDTESKQWAETSVKTLCGVVKIFNAQRPVLLHLANFADCFSRLLSHIELAAQTDNTEMSLAALKNLQDLLFGRQQPNESTGSVGRGGRVDADSSNSTTVPPLPDPLWLVSWNSWFRVAQAIVSPDCPAPPLDFSAGAPCAAEVFVPTTKKHYVPSLYHLTTLLDVFISLFQRTRHQVPVDDLRSHRICQIFLEIAAIPMSADPSAISLQQGAEHLNMAQERLLTAIRTTIQEQMEQGSPLRAALPDLLKLLLSFFGFAIHPPNNKFAASAQNSGAKCDAMPSQNLIAFAEASLKTLLEYYVKTATFEENVQQTVLVYIVKHLNQPLSLKYRCASQSTWQLAVTTLITACQVGLPIARENVNLFKTLWPAFAKTVEDFLFSASKTAHPLNADERKRHEFMDCLVIELIRTELLSHASALPREFMQRIIEILNRGSINTMDANDVLASDAYQQKADLSRVCFDALLSLSRAESPTAAMHHQKSAVVHNQAEGVLRNTNQSMAACSTLGAAAISSLLTRCKQVLNDYARDEQNSGHFRLPQERIFEAISALRAVTAMIEGFSKNPNSTLYSHLVTLYPSLVQLIPSSRGDQQIELALMTCLNSYQTLLLLNLHNK